MKDGSNTRVALATTAIEAYWGDPADGDVVFLGPWCLTPSRRAAWEPLRAGLATSRFDDETTWLAHWADALAHAEALFEELVPETAAALNAEHEISSGQRWWRGVVGPWLQMWCYAVTERVAILEDALAAHPEAVLVAPEGGAPAPAPGTLSFAEALKTDAFNARLYGSVAETLGYPVHRVPAADPPAENPTTPSVPGIARCAAAQAVRAVAWARAGRVVWHRQAYLPLGATLALAWHSGGRVLPLLTPSLAAPILPADLERRVALRTRLARGGEDAAGRVARNLLADYLPTAFLEGFAILGEAVAHTYPVASAAVFSLNGWYFDEPFKRWAADAAAGGAVLFGGQHGGNYGVSALAPSEDFERSLVDRYFTWGWEEPARPGDAETVGMPATLLLETHRLPVDPAARGILFAGTSQSRHIPSFASGFERYLAWQERFACALRMPVKAELVVRLHREDMGWEIAGRWREWCPEAPLQDWDVSFADALARCRLFVCDHLSTTYAQALASRKPTVLFWDPSANPVRPAAVPLLDGLRAVGILHDTPESAAAEVERAYVDVVSWWNDPARQSAVDMFCERYARTADDGVAQWLGEFDRVLHGDVTKRTDRT